MKQTNKNYRNETTKGCMVISHVKNFPHFVLVFFSQKNIFIMKNALSEFNGSAKMYASTKQTINRA